jgi:tetratricopeptide (TPR) repeat protein
MSAAGSAAPPPAVDWRAKFQAAQAALAADPNDGLAQLQRAHATLGLGRPTQATAMLALFLKRFPRVGEAWTLQSVALLQSGRATEAEAAADKALALAPDDAAARYNRACARVRLNRQDEALADLTVALSGRPALVDAARADPDLAPLRPLAAFTRLLAEAARNPAPTPAYTGPAIPNQE